MWSVGRGALCTFFGLSVSFSWTLMVVANSASLASLKYSPISLTDAFSCCAIHAALGSDDDDGDDDGDDEEEEEDEDEDEGEGAGARSAD